LNRHKNPPVREWSLSDQDHENILSLLAKARQYSLSEQYWE
ncbi:hypothetical protein A2U01_0099927, partial [Trifolium medium]|nr:hypothetical protein [Trifolium medium]